MKRIVITGFLVLSLSFASLINTTDQTNNDDYALGGNSASSAYFKSTGFEGGLTMFDLFGQSKSILDNQGLIGNKGSTYFPYMFTNLYGQYTYSINNDNWLCVGYANDSNPVAGIKDKTDDSVRKATYIEDEGTESLYAAYSYDAAKFVKGLFVGAELAFNKDFNRRYAKVNAAEKSDSNYEKSEATLITSTQWYTSLAFSGMYDMGKLGMITAAQKFYAAKNWDLSGQKDLNGSKSDIQYNEESQPETSIGYIFPVAKDISLGGTVLQAWDKDYTETRSADGSYTESDVHKFAYRTYTAWGEYSGLMKGLTLQAYYGFGFDVGRTYAGDAENDNDGTNDTYMGANGSMTFGAHTVLVGMARTVSLGISPKDLTDETKMYVNYGYAF